MTSKTAVLLINLGTPKDLTKKSIKGYLREFLLDKRVITLPWLLRFLLVNCFIIPFRSNNTLKAYKSIWTTTGSPLLINSLKLKQNLQVKLNSINPTTEQESLFSVYLAMRYGDPNIKTILEQLQHNNYTRIIIVPLYPQYASASTGSVLEKSLKHLSDFRYFPEILCLNHFFSLPGYINSQAHILNKYLEHNQNKNTHTLFSYHGIPKQQLQLSDNRHCKPDLCSDNAECPTINYPNKCYRAQCYATTRAIANKLNLAPDQYSTSFQSRLGKLPWVKPYTDEIVKQLRHQGITKLIVISPSFVSDCLETLEEIGIRLRKDWLTLGGTEFTLVPCLNDEDIWIESLASYIKDNC